MKVCSLFAGIGGFEIALTKLGHEIVFSNEWDKYAAQIYDRNFSVRTDTRDIRTVPTSDIPDHDLLVGGFPCQAFSVAGKRLGFQDTRGTLFFEIARILRDKRPRYILLENVKGLLSHDAGKTFSTILGVLSDIGYDVQWQVLNSKNFGVPQNRERVFIVGHLRGQPKPEVFPLRNGNQSDLSKVGQTQSEGERIRRPYISATVDANYYKGPGSTRQMIEVTSGVSDAQRIYDSTGIAKTLKGLGGGMGAKTGLYSVQRQPLRFLERNQKNIEGDYSFTVDSSNTGGVRIGMQVRRLTPVECERLQGFPDDFTKYGVDNKGNLIQMSDTQRYKVLGNAVTTNVVYEVASRLT